MAASTQPAERPLKMLALALLLIVPLLNSEVMAQDQILEEPAIPFERGDDIPDPGSPQVQTQVLPTLQPRTSERTTTPLTTEKGGNHNGNDLTTRKEATTEGTKPPERTTAKPGTPAPHRGDGPNDTPKPKGELACVFKEASLEGKNAVHLKLKTPSLCLQTLSNIWSVLDDLCEEHCRLEIYQAPGTNEALVSGKTIEDDVIGMTNKFNNDNIKDKANIEEATYRWGKNSKLVLVSLLLAGLLLAALLVAGYYLKMHRKTSKGVRLAESFQVDEENQTNTLVSVAPLPQEPVDKPTANGESPPENGNNPPPTTNGHSANQTQVADTEM